MDATARYFQNLAADGFKREAIALQLDLDRALSDLRSCRRKLTAAEAERDGLARDCEELMTALDQMSSQRFRPLEDARLVDAPRVQLGRHLRETPPIAPLPPPPVEDLTVVSSPSKNRHGGARARAGRPFSAVRLDAVRAKRSVGCFRAPVKCAKCGWVFVAGTPTTKYARHVRLRLCGKEK